MRRVPVGCRRLRAGCAAGTAITADSARTDGFWNARIHEPASRHLEFLELEVRAGRRSSAPDQSGRD